MAGIQSYLQSHRCILLANVVVVLVSIKHDDSIGQGKAGIAIGKWGAITILKNQRPHLCQCPSLANQTLTTNPLVNADKEGRYQPERGPSLAYSLMEAGPSMGKLTDIALSLLRRQQLGPSVEATETLSQINLGCWAQPLPLKLTLQCSVNASSNLWMTGASPGKRKASR